MKLTVIASFVFALIMAGSNSMACTRVVYKGDSSIVMTARSMDWKEDIKSNIWLFPRKMQRSGQAGPNSLKWESKYGSIITTGYDNCAADGMNEKGLVANLLWLDESEYPKWTPDKPAMAVSLWVQYVLDCFATVDETVKELEKENFIVLTDKVPGMDILAKFHISVSDATGDNAIFEYIDGKLKVYHDTAYVVLTNSPAFNDQLAINSYFMKRNGLNDLPGSNQSSDRFVRGSFYVNALPKTYGSANAFAGILSVIRNCSVPFGISTPNQPNISTTRWRVVADQRDLKYYFDSVLSPNIIWLDLSELDFSPKAHVKKLDIEKGEVYEGNVKKHLKVSAPFKFAGL